jgi:hypothetical protein
VIGATMPPWPGESEAYFVKGAGIPQSDPMPVSTQLHRGIAGSGAFLNYAVWETVEHFRRAFENPEFRTKLDLLSCQRDGFAPPASQSCRCRHLRGLVSGIRPAGSH